jgi:hypothetical protein
MNGPPHAEAELLTEEIQREEIAGPKKQSVADSKSQKFPSKVEKKKLAEAFDRLFEVMNIQAKPIGAEKLQEMMKEANLEPNELSRGIIEMRDE